MKSGSVSPILALLLFAAPGLLPAQNSVGIFEDQTDIGAILHPGSAAFDPSSGTFTLTGSGDNMWAADISFENTSGNAHKKGVLMFRRSLDADSEYVDGALHVVGLTSIQSRSEKGGQTREVQSYIPSPKRMRLVKQGDTVFLFVAGEDGVFHLSGGSMKFNVDGPFYVGLGACAHDRDAVEKVSFSNVELIPGPVSGKPVAFSTLEAQTSDRRAIWVAPGGMEAPFWLKDGKTVLFSYNRHLQKIVAATGSKPEPVDTGKLSHIGPYNGISPDGAMLAVTDEGKGKAKIYVLPMTGGAPRLITKRSPSRFSAWSPDGRTILFTSARKGSSLFFTVAAEGGDEKEIVAGDATAANPTFSPDGKYIYFDSARGGSRQIWRMLADGSAPEQITSDEFTNSNPHLSPDGTQIAFLSTGGGATGASQTNETRVRLLSLAGRTVRIMGIFPGGSGTFGSAPWAADNRTLTFVSDQEPVLQSNGR